MAEVVPQQWSEVLLHAPEAFTKESIQKRAEETQISPERVEVANWLLEITAQAAEVIGEILDEGSPLVLRGGTSAQLMVGEGRQRMSGDVDFLLRGRVEDAERLVDELNKRLAPCAPFLQFERRERTVKPIAKFAFWQCYVPRQFGAARPGSEDEPGRTVLFEVHAIEDDEGPPTEPLSGTVFGLALQGEISALTPGALLGDKLDCLAPNSIGIPGDDYVKHARHIFDIAMLEEKLHEEGGLTAKVLDDAVESITYFTLRDAEVRDRPEVSPEETMEDVQAFLAPWGWPPNIAGSPAGRQLEKAQGFEQYVPQGRRARRLTWIQRALRAGLLAKAVRDAVRVGGDAALQNHNARMEDIQRLANDEDGLREQLAKLFEHRGITANLKALSNQLLPRRANPLQRSNLTLLVALELGDEALVASQ